QDSAAGACEHLGKRAAPRLHHGYGVSHRFQHGKALRLIVGARHAHHVEIAQEFDLTSAIQLAAVAELARQTRVAHLFFDAAQVSTMLGREVAGRVEHSAVEVHLAAQLDVALGQKMQALFRRDASQISHSEAVGVETEAGIAILQIDAERYYVDFARRNAEALAPVVRGEFADCRITIHVRRISANQLPRLRPVWFRQLAEKKIFALQRAAQGTADSLANRLREAGQQAIRKRDDFRRRFAGQPARQLPDVLALVAIL